MKVFSLMLLFLVASSSVMAGTTYTPKQLKNMINSGKYPKQGAVAETQKRNMDFYDCKEYSDSMYSQLSPMYPVQVVVNTEVLYMLKAWTNDGVVLVTCSEPDNRMVLTRSKYK